MFPVDLDYKKKKNKKFMRERNTADQKLAPT